LREVSENVENTARSGHPRVHSSDDNVKKVQKIVVQTKSAVNQACDIEILMR
jgi:hypothetical protein